MMKKCVLFLAGALAGWAISPARGTTLFRLSLEQLTRASSDIIRGHVVGQESRWNSTHTQIVTLTTIGLDRVVKGQPPSTLVIVQPGGMVDNLHARVAGTVHFYPNADYLLFLEPASSDPSRYLVVGMAQGAFRIYRDAETREERVIRPFGGLFYRAGENGGGSRTPDQTVALHTFEHQLSTALRAPLLIPKGTSIPVAIQATEFRGVGRVHVLGRTTAEIYPNSNLLIPAGSPVEGTARLAAGKWNIYWTGVSIRGADVRIKASNEQLSGGSLRGRVIFVRVR